MFYLYQEMFYDPSWLIYVMYVTVFYMCAFYRQCMLYTTPQDHVVKLINKKIIK